MSNLYYQEHKEQIDVLIQRDILNINDFILITNILSRVFFTTDVDKSCVISNFNSSTATAYDCAALLQKINHYCKEAEIFKREYNKQASGNIYKSVLGQLKCSCLNLMAVAYIYWNHNNNLPTVYNINTLLNSVLAFVAAINLISAILLPINTYFNAKKHEAWRVSFKLANKGILPCESDDKFVRKLRNALKFAKDNNLLLAQPSITTQQLVLVSYPGLLTAQPLQDAIQESLNLQSHQSRVAEQARA